MKGNVLFAALCAGTWIYAVSTQHQNPVAWGTMLIALWSVYAAVPWFFRTVLHVHNPPLDEARRDVQHGSRAGFEDKWRELLTEDEQLRLKKSEKLHQEIEDRLQEVRDLVAHIEAEKAGQR